MWDRSVLSPSKHRVIGNMFCIRSYTKVCIESLSSFREILNRLFIFSVLVSRFFASIYQVQGTFWRALFFYLVLSAPVLSLVVN